MDPAPTSTTAVPAATTSTTLPQALEDQVALLAESVREIRGLDLTVPSIEYRPRAELEARYHELRWLPSIGDGRFDSAYLRMLGVLEDGGTIADLVSFCSIPGLYDPAAQTLMLDEQLDELTPFGRRHLVGELTTAATDAAYGWWDLMESQQDLGNGEAAAAAWALVQGDASFHAGQYVERELSATDRFAIRLEEIACQQERVAPPGFVMALEEYGPEAGRWFVEDLISNGGPAAVDAAYSDPPISTEQIYHPARFAAREGVIEVELPELAVSGFSEIDSGTFGERIFRALLSEGVTSAQALQAATGWGGDTYRVLWNGSEVVLVLAFEGDDARDARELAETVGGWASASLRVGSGRPDNTGLAFEGEEYAFVAHADEAMLLVLSSDAAAGRTVRNMFWPRW